MNGERRWLPLLGLGGDDRPTCYYLLRLRHMAHVLRAHSTGAFPALLLHRSL